MIKMKKIFAIISSVFAVAICILLVTLSFVRKNVTLGIGDPYMIMVYNKSTTALEGGYQKGNEKYNKVLEKLNEVTNLTLFDWLLHENSLNITPSQDLDNQFSQYSTDMKSEYIAVEILFSGDNHQQDTVVTVNGNTKVVSYDCIIMILPTNNNYSDIVVYYSLGSPNQDEQYKVCQPIILKGRAGSFIKFVSTL